ncbi:LysR substrate-binding domain-containing protein [Chitinimonas naiadis]
MATADRLGGIAAFVSAVEAGSFSAAAERLNLSRSAVGKSVARLEERVGVRLFHRTTRSQSLTDEGQAFYARCVRALAELEQAEDELAQGQQAPSGKLRITMPVLFGRHCIAPVLLDLARRYPRLQIEASFSDRRSDVVEEGYDLAVRSGTVADTPGLKVRKLGEHQMLVVAAPGYLTQRGTPQSLTDLASHDGILYGRAGRLGEWQFRGPDGGQINATIQPRLAFDDLEALLDAAKAGLGIARLPDWLTNQSLREGALVRLLPQETSLTFAVHLLWPQTRHLAPKVRVVIDALAEVIPPILNRPPFGG